MLIKPSNHPYLSTFPRLIVIFLILLGMFGFQSIQVVHAVSVLYVQPSGLTSGICASWASACELQYALSLAVSGDEIWVATGIYYPTSVNERSTSFVLLNNIGIFGGFNGTETLRSQRNPAVNVTTLSGDIDTVGNISDNSYHVVNGSGTDGSAVLDGFTITGGNAVDDTLNPYGGGILNVSGSPTLSNLVIEANTAFYGGGVFNITNSSPQLANITISENSAVRGGGIYNTLNSNPILINVTFNANTASTRGGGVANSGSDPTLINVTFSGNISSIGGGMHNVTASNPILMNVTFSGNSASTDGGGIYNNENSNPIITNSILFGNTGGEIFSENSVPVVTYSIIQGGYTGQGNLDADPLLGALQHNGGSTQTMALGTGSPAIDAGDDGNCPETDQRGVARPQGDHCDIGAYEYDGTFANVQVKIAGNNVGNHNIPSLRGIRPSYSGVNDGPVKVQSMNGNGIPIVAALRDLWSGGSNPSSSIQLMGLPENQLSDTYWFPAYNNVSLDDQLRFGNVGMAPTNVTVTIGGIVRGTYPLNPSQSVRVNYPGVDSGPVKVQSSGGVKIIASIRDSWHDGTKWSSYSQLMGLPNSQLSDTYLFPAYNNVSLDDQLRFGNVGTAPTDVTVTIGGIPHGPYHLNPNQSLRVSYPGVDGGPVKVQSSGGVKIIASIRDAWFDGTKWTSYFQLMGLPFSQLSDTYLFPAYDNVSLDGQLRFGNVGTSPTTVTVTINGVVKGTYPLNPNQSVRVNYAGLDSGPVKIQSSGGVKIIASLRDAWFDGSSWTSYSQLMGLPGGQLTTSYYFPAYNNVTYDNQLRIGVP